ncbi:MAG: ribosome maturation factor RimP [Gammaproteobacteria bacterium]|nr:ribosome maturation factor RimP [Gammaproteobacteria bacterium]
MQGPLKLQQLLEPVVTGLGYEFVGIEYQVHSQNALLRLYIDKEGGVNVDDCAQVSWQVSALLDVEEPVQGNYTLEVSSPGLDRLLFNAEHFERFAGQQVKLQLESPLDGRRRLRGKLLGMSGSNVMIEDESQQVEVPMELIKKARLVAAV